MKTRETCIQKLFMQSPLPTAIIDQQEHFIYVNPAFTKITNYSEQELLNPDFSYKKLLPTDEQKKTYLLKDALSIKLSFISRKTVYITKNGEKTNMQEHLSIIQEDSLSSIQYLLVLSPFFLAEQPEKTLVSPPNLDWQPRFKVLVENSLAGVYHSLLDGTILYVNDALVQFFEFASKEEMMKYSTEGFYRNVEDRKKIIQTLKEKNKIANFSTDFVTHKGNIRHAIMSATIYGKEMIGTIMDVTPLQESETRFRTLAENSPDIIARFDKQLKHTYVNPFGTKVYGVPNEQVLGKTNADLGMPPEKVAFWKKHFEQVFKTGKQTSIEFEFKSANLGLCHFWSLFVPEKNEKGQVESILAITRDITKRKNAEELLKKNERHFAEETLRYNAIIRQMTEGLVIFDPQGNLIDMNPAALAIHGFETVNSLRKPLDELTNVFEIYDLDDNPLPTSQWPIGRALKGEVFDSYEVKVVRKDNAKTWIGSYGGTRVHDREGNLIMVIVTLRDITQTKKIEEALRQSEERFKSVLDHSLDFVYRRNLLSDSYDYISPAIEQITGFSIQEFKNFPLETVLNMIHPDDQERIKKQIGILKNANHGVRLFEYRLRCKDGTFKWVADNAKLIRDKNGNIKYLIGVVRDITLQKIAEEVVARDRETLEQLVNAQTEKLLKIQKENDRQNRLTDLGMLSATVAHELRNPLAGIKMAATNIDRKVFKNPLFPKPEIQKSLENINKKVMEADQIISNLLFYSRLREPHQECIQITKILNESIESACNRYSCSQVEVKKELQKTEKLITKADPVQIQELFVNLINNSLEAIGKEKGTIIISAEVNKENNIVIKIKDSGKGIPSEHLPHIFKPFYTTKSKGTGLGLAVCRQIITLHHGEIFIEATSSQGTIITVLIPAIGT